VVVVAGGAAVVPVVVVTVDAGALVVVGVSGESLVVLVTTWVVVVGATAEVEDGAAPARSVVGAALEPGTSVVDDATIWAATVPSGEGRSVTWSRTFPTACAAIAIEISVAADHAATIPSLRVIASSSLMASRRGITDG
jgi:hypothetical protein